jgi:hypothetical protein
VKLLCLLTQPQGQKQIVTTVAQCHHFDRLPIPISPQVQVTPPLLNDIIATARMETIKEGESYDQLDKQIRAVG